MSRYVLTAEAQHDLTQIRDYVLKAGGFRAARYVVGSLVTGFRALARTPGQGHRRDDLSEREELRFRAVFSYLIVYRVDKNLSLLSRSSTASATLNNSYRSGNSQPPR